MHSIWYTLRVYISAPGFAILKNLLLEISNKKARLFLKCKNFWNKDKQSYIQKTSFSRKLFRKILLGPALCLVYRWPMIEKCVRINWVVCMTSIIFADISIRFPINKSLNKIGLFSDPYWFLKWRVDYKVIHIIVLNLIII